jgi:SNF2 family DNA or RNA helicase
VHNCHRLKSAAGKQSRTASRISDRVPFRLGLTGTPMPHSPLDVYAQFRALDKSIYGTTHAAFKARYAVMGGYQQHQVVAFRDLDDLRERMDRVTYRCKAGDVLSLPEFTDVTYTCALDKRTRQVYDAMEQDFVAMLEAGVITADNALVKLLRLAQIANGHATTEDGDSTQLGTEKRDLLAEVLDDLHGDYDAVRQEPVVVFTRFRPDLRAIREVAREKGLRDGELSGTHNDLQAWHDGDVDLLAVQLQAGGVGIDLTRARYCVYYSHDFSLGNDAQTRARVHRPGQTRAVTYIHLVAQDTIDEDIRAALEKRADVVETVLAGLTSGVRA